VFGLRRLAAVFTTARAPMGQFLDLACKSGLVGSDALRDAYTDFCSSTCVSGSHEGGVDAFCQYLVARKILTLWQCEKLKEGRYKGFFIDDCAQYRILSHVRTEESFAVYMVDDTRTGHRVHLHILPAARPGPPPTDEYRTTGDVIYRIEEIGSP
jgi:hypothetical protein